MSPMMGSSAYGQVSQVTSLIRSLLMDAAGNWATDAVLIPYVASAYRTVQRKLANAGSDLFITDDVELVIFAVSAAQQDPGTVVVLNDAGAPPNQLPSNLLNPLKLWERPNLSTVDFEEMENWTSKGGLPSRLQGASLDDWEFRTDGLYFIGATQDTQIRLRYNAAFPDLTGPTDVVLIRGAQEALAYVAAGLAGIARGAPLAEQMEQLATDYIEDLISANVRAQQNQGTRRRPYGRRCRSGMLGGRF